MSAHALRATLPPMADERPPRALYDELVALPENVIGEIIGGQLVTQARPAIPHAYAATNLSAELNGPFHRGRGGPGGWILLYEPELHLRADVLVPDLAGWRIERMPEVPETPAVRLAPDWVCEVLSPSTAAIDRADKLPIYARERVAHAWLVDPLTRTLEAFRLEAGRWVLLGTWREDAKVRVEPFEVFELELAGLW